MAILSRRVVRSFWIFGAAAALGCGGSGGGPTSNGNSGGSHFTARIDGASWSSGTQYIASAATHSAPGLYIVQGTQLLSGNNPVTILISLYNIRGTGTYALGVGPTVVGGTALVAQPSAGWATPLSGGSGSITLTSLTSSRIAGTLEFVAEPSNGSATGSKTVTQGDFDVPLSVIGSAGPVPDNAGSEMSSVIGGQDWNAATVAVSTASGSFIVTASNTESTLSILLGGVTSPGTYSLGVSPIRSITVSGGANGELCCWGGSSADVGSIILTSVTSTRAIGTFSATLQPSPGSAVTSPLLISNGAFDVGIIQAP
jgi:hypothetical protein